MSEEVKPVTPEILETPVQEAAPQEPERVELTPTEEIAYEQGWRPKEEFSGNPDEWRPAKEWLERGELISKIKRLGNEVQEMRQSYHQLHQQNMQVARQAYQKAIQDLRAQRRAALENDDFVAADAIEERIDAIKDHVREADRPQQAQQQAPVQSEAYQAWVSRNPWYLEDEELHIYADAAVAHILKKNGGPMDPKLLGSLVEERVKTRFPEKFGKGKGSSAPPSPSIGGTHRGASRPSGNGKFAEAKKSMSDGERQIMDTYVNKLKLMTEDEYMADYVNARSGS